MIWEKSEGMLLRDYFAGQALIGILSGNSCKNERENAFMNSRKAAVWAYEFADAMLAEREKAIS